MRGAGVELGGFPRLEDEVVLAEDEPQSAVEDECPVVALMGAQIGFSVVSTCGKDELVRLNASGAPGQREDGPTIPGWERAKVDARIPGRGCVDELVQGGPECARQGEELFKCGTPATGFES